MSVPAGSGRALPVRDRVLGRQPERHRRRGDVPLLGPRAAVVPVGELDRVERLGEHRRMPQGGGQQHCWARAAMQDAIAKAEAAINTAKNAGGRVLPGGE
jgi:hypothetical protein